MVTKDLDLDDLFDLTSWGDELVAELSPLYDSLADEAGSDLAAAFDLDDYDTRNPSVRRMLDARKNLVRGCNDTTYALLRATLAEGEEAGESIDKLARRVEGVFASARGPRSVTIARTEVIGASQAAQHIAGVEAKATHKTWLAASDARTRDSHVRADGQRVKMTETFNVGGTRMRHPGAQGAPASEVVNCRCTMLIERSADDVEVVAE